VNEHRFVNRSQPQTLYMAVVLAYLNVLFNVLGPWPILVPIAIFLAVGAYGIANEQKWGYSLAVGFAVLQVVMLFALAGTATFTDIGALIDLIFYGALVGLLLHPMSRDYQRIWFR
jgi:hypothetical protein